MNFCRHRPRLPRYGIPYIPSKSLFKAVRMALRMIEGGKDVFYAHSLAARTHVVSSKDISYYTTPLIDQLRSNKKTDSPEKDNLRTRAPAPEPTTQVPRVNAALEKGTEIVSAAREPPQVRHCGVPVPAPKLSPRPRPDTSRIWEFLSTTGDRSAPEPP